MNIAVEVPEEVAKIVEAQPDKQGFLIEAIQREWSRRNAVKQLLKLSERISARREGMTDVQLEKLPRD